jgi:hypothetical protein
MKNQNIRIPLIIGVVLVVSSVIPILQILIMQLNGAILYGVTELMGMRLGLIELVANGVISIILLSIFYKSQKFRWKTASAILVALFLMPMFIYWLERKIDEEALYFLQFMIAGAATGLILLVVGFLKGFSSDK